ncbi:MAG: CPBP family intramembrane metalloprotease [Gammaproteobacteria bacterium]|nr:CPBP family intramembrane metalloprotease [Gammaproteobacteria bacterium]
MRALILFVTVIAGAVLAGAMLAYPSWLAASIFTEARFEKVITRSSAISALIASLIYLRATGGWSLDGIGLATRSRAWRGPLLTGMATGATLIFGMEVLLLSLGVHEPEAGSDFGFAALAAQAGLALMAGILIGFIEEILFRGALYGAAERAMGATAATLLTSAVYAAAHYLKYPAPPPGEAIGWLTWIKLYPTALNWFYYRSVYDAMAALFLLGVLLCVLRRHFGHIYTGMGLHAGIATALLMVKYATDHVRGAPWSFLVSRYDNYQGWLAAAVLLTAIVALTVIDRHRGAATTQS